MKYRISQRICIFWFLCFWFSLSSGLPAAARASSAELIFTSREIVVENRKMVTRYSYDLLINDRSADYLSKIRIPYSGIDKLVSLDASLHTADGTLVRKLPRNEITSQHDISDYSLYEDQYVKIFTLRNSAYPYRIKWSYTIESSAFVNICNWIPVMMTEIPTRRATLTFIAPESYKVRIDSAGLLGCTYRKGKEHLIREYECSFTDSYKEEVFQANDTEHLPYVRIMPLQFHFETDGRAGSWKEFGLWIYNLNQGLDGLPQSEKDFISSLKNEGLAGKALIRKLYNYVQDRTRYVNVTLETGGFKPYAASYVSNNAYGDCKALSVYFKALLTEAGIQADYVLVKAGEKERDINTSFVSNQFNHAIVLVPYEGDSIWLDCTSDNPFGYTGTFIQGRHALVTGKEGGFLVRIPALSKEQVCITRKGTIRLLANLPSLIDLKIETGGRQAEYLRSVNSNLDDAERFRVIEKIISIPSFIADSISLLSPDRQEQRISLNYAGTSNSLLKSFGNTLICHMIPVDLPNFESSGERITSLKIPYPQNVSDSLWLNIPPGYKIEGLTKDKEIVSEFGSYHFSYSASEAGILFKRKFILNSGTVTSDKYTDFYSFTKQIGKIEASGAISFIKM
ncbi:MAG: DUF3857 domain-containing protein [Lentimicrobium sp.]